MTAWKDKTLYERIIDRDSKLKSEFEFFESARETIVERVRPDLTVGTTEDKGAFSGSKIIEGSAYDAAATMARGFMSNMVGKSIDWFRHLVRERFFKGNDNVNKWLLEFDDYMREAYRRSNYYDILYSYTLGGITTGSPVSIGEENEAKGITHFSLPHYSTCRFTQDWFGDDVILHVDLKLTARKAAQHFGKDNLSSQVQRQLELGNHNYESDYLMVFYAAGDDIFDDLKDDDYKQIKRALRPWMVFVIEKSTDEDKKKPIYSNGYWEKPFNVWHYNRLDFECCSRTPAWYAIYDITGNDSVWETVHRVGQNVARPAMWARKMVKAKLALGAGAVNYTDAQLFKDRPAPINEGLNYPFGMNFAERSVSNVQRHFFYKLWKMIEMFSLEHKTPPTAFQIARMEEEKFTQIGPVVGGYESGVLSPHDSLVMDIERRAFRLPPPPEEVLQHSEGDIDPIFTGPLAMAQKVFLSTRRSEMALQAIAPYLQIYPEVKYKIRPEKDVERILEDLGYIQEGIVSDEDYYAILDAQRRHQEMQNLLEQGSQVAEMVPKLQGETQKGSPMAELLEEA